MLNVGFIGGGNITDTHIRAAQAIPQLRPTAVVGTNASKVKALAEKYGLSAFNDLREFLGHRPLDLVIIGSPSGVHAKEGIAACEQGLHVLVEKPIDVSTQRADQLIRSAKTNGVKLGVLFQDRLKPDILRLRDRIKSGKLGRILLVEASVKWYRPPEYYSNSKWRGTASLDGGGALMNQGIHTVDLLLYLLGGIDRVQAVTKTALHEIQSEDTCVATLEFANGAIGVLHATTAAYPGYARRLEITGSEGTVRIEHDRITKIDLRKDVEADGLEIEHASELADQNASANSPVVGDVRGHQRIVEDFISAIETGRNPVCDGEEGRRSLAIVESIYRAARTGAA